MVPELELEDELLEDELDEDDELLDDEELLELELLELLDEDELLDGWPSLPPHPTSATIAANRVGPRIVGDKFIFFMARAPSGLDD
jgi:hypothetical protein